MQLRSGLKAQVDAVMAKGGVLPRVTDMFRPAGPPREARNPMTASSPSSSCTINGSRSASWLTPRRSEFSVTSHDAATTRVADAVLV